MVKIDNKIQYKKEIFLFSFFFFLMFIFFISGSFSVYAQDNTLNYNDSYSNTFLSKQQPLYPFYNSFTISQINQIYSERGFIQLILPLFLGNNLLDILESVWTAKEASTTLKNNLINPIAAKFLWPWSDQTSRYSSAILLIHMEQQLRVKVTLNQGRYQTLDGRSIMEKGNQFFIIPKQILPLKTHEYTNLTTIFHLVLQQVDFSYFFIRQGSLILYDPFVKRAFSQEKISHLDKKQLISLFYLIFPQSQCREFQDWVVFPKQDFVDCLENVFHQASSLFVSS